MTIVPDYEAEIAGYSITHDPWETVQIWERPLEGAMASGDLAALENVWVRNTASAFRASIITLMAGAEAEIVILGRCRGGDSCDRREIKLVLNSGDAIPLDQCEKVWGPRMRRQTRRLIHRHNEKIVWLAKALREIGTLEAGEVAMIVNGDRQFCCND